MKILIKNYLSVSATYMGSQASIHESAIQIINILKSLSVMDELFLHPIFITGQKGRIAVDLSNSCLVEQTELISEALLRSSKYDIKLYENVNNPDENYRRKDGFRIMMEFKVDHKTSFYCTCRMGAELCQTFTFLGYKDVVLKEYFWYFNLLKILVEKLVCVEGEIFIKAGNFGGFYVGLKVNHHLHWISYYSNDFYLKIPDDIGGVEYLHTDKGKYLITSQDDFLKDKESFEHHKEKIKGIVDEMKARIPGFAKE
jgi:hypothetical protein